MKNLLFLIFFFSFSSAASADDWNAFADRIRANNSPTLELMSINENEAHVRDSVNNIDLTVQRPDFNKAVEIYDKAEANYFHRQPRNTVDDLISQKKSLKYIADSCTSLGGICVAMITVGTAFWPSLLGGLGCAAVAIQCNSQANDMIEKIDLHLESIKEQQEAARSDPERRRRRPAPGNPRPLTGVGSFGSGGGGCSGRTHVTTRADGSVTERIESRTDCPE